MEHMASLYKMHCMNGINQYNKLYPSLQLFSHQSALDLTQLNCQPGVTSRYTVAEILTKWFGASTLEHFLSYNPFAQFLILCRG